MRCRACHRRLRDDREDLKARCPYCRAALDEASPPRLRTAGPGDSVCAVHPRSPVVGRCDRCGSFVCTVCKTTWHKTTLCAGCLDHLLDTGQTETGPASSTTRQAVLSLVFGIAAWLVTFGGLILAGIGAIAGMNVALLALANLTMMASSGAGVMGIGLGASVIYSRGEQMILATVGMLLGSLQLGAVLGLFGFSIWQR